MSELVLVQAQGTVALNREAKPSIMYMPAGANTIRATVNGKAKQTTIHVSEKSVPLLQASLEKLNSDPIKPFLDFDHNETVSAGTPKSFRWEPDGIYLDLDWSKSGRESVEGGDYAYFSPSFLINASGEPVNLPEEGSIGALTNRPAFRKMRGLLASHNKKNGGDTGKPNKRGTMSQKIIDALVLAGFITDEDSEDEQAAVDAIVKASKSNKRSKDSAELTALKASHASLADEVKTVRAENATLQASLSTVQAERVDAEIAALFTSAEADGRIEPKNEKVKASIRSLYKIDAQAAKDLVDGLPKKRIFDPVVTVKAGQSVNHQDAPAGDRGEKSKTLVRKVLAANPGMTNEDAWKQVEQDHPELFAVNA